MDITERARSLRKNMTEAEKRLWSHLRNRQLDGHKFYRQFAIPPYVVDFVCRDKKLVIELDGGQHADNVKADEQRTTYLEEQGYRVLRFWNNDVLRNTEGTLHEILRVLDTLTPTLSLKEEGVRAGAYE